MKQHKKTQILVLTALLTAFTTVATMLIRIPTPTKGYLNLGDTFVNISAWLLGAGWGTAAAGIGSALADILSGYMVYAPITLIVKSLMALASYSIYKALSEKINTFPARITAAVVAEIIMVAGYAVFEGFMYQSVVTALSGVPSNLVQGIFGVAASVTVYELILKRIPQLHVKK